MKKENSQADIPLLGVSSESHRLGAPVLGSYTGEDLTGWRTNRRAV